MTIVENPTITVTGGVDTHLEFHVAAAVDANGGVLGVDTFKTTTGGYRQLVAWLAGFGEISLVGVEGTAPMAPASPVTSPAKASGSSRSTARTAKHDIGPASPTRSTRSPPPAPR